MFDEIVPFVPLPDAERRAYAETIMERFANPYIRHELISIALNSVSKWQVRVLPTVKDYVAKHGKAPAGLSFSLAALLNFYHGKVLANGEYEGERQGQPYPIRDNADILEVMNNAWKHHGENLDKLVCEILANTHLWGENLTKVAGLAEQTTASLEKIKASGVKAAMQTLL